MSAKALHSRSCRRQRVRLGPTAATERYQQPRCGRSRLPLHRPTSPEWAECQVARMSSMETARHVPMLTVSLPRSFLKTFSFNKGTHRLQLRRYTGSPHYRGHKHPLQLRDGSIEPLSSANDHITSNIYQEASTARNAFLLYQRSHQHS